MYLHVCRPKKEKTDETHNTDGDGAHLDAQMHAPETGREARIRAGNGRNGSPGPWIGVARALPDM